MFNRLKDKTTSGTGKSGYAPKEDHPLLKVQVAKTLLNTPEFTQTLKKIKTHTRLSEAKFKTFYLQTVFNFSEFVQKLPLTQTGRLSRIGSALELGLERAEIALAEYQAYLKSMDLYPESLSAEHELWNYVTFSAALLKDVATVALEHSVGLYDQQKKLKVIWSPYHGNMISLDAEFYSYRFRSDHRDGLSSSALPLLAERVLPDIGREFITRYPEAMSTWLALLNSDEGDRSGSGGLALRLLLWSEYMARARLSAIDHDASFSVQAYIDQGIISKAEKKASSAEQLGAGLAGEESTAAEEAKKQLEQDKQDQADQHEKNLEKVKNKKLKSQKSQQDKSKSAVKAAAAEKAALAARRYDMVNGKPSDQKNYVDLGAEFIRWVRQGLATGVITTNQPGAMVHVTPQGMLLVSQGLLKTFAATLHNPVHWQVVVNQLAVLALFALNTSGRLLHSAVQNGHKVEGLLIRDAKMLMNNPVSAKNFELTSKAVEQASENAVARVSLDPGSPPAGF